MKVFLLRILKAPILHISLTAIFLFLVYEALLPPEKEEIIITQQTMNSLIRSVQELRENPLSDEEMLDLIQMHIDEEVLIREAYRQGLDRNNYRVRKQLIDLMRSGLNDTIQKPSQEVLREFYEENRDDFRIPGLRNFKHVFFSGENQPAPADLQSFLDYFEQTGSDFTRAGDLYLNGYEFRHLSFEQCSIFFGREFASALFDLPDASWAGPIASSEGIHYVLMENVIPSQIPNYEDIRNYLVDSYVFAKNRESQEKKIRKMRESYRIIIEDADS